MQTGPSCLSLTRLVFWLALLPHFPRCSGVIVPKLFPRCERRACAHVRLLRTAPPPRALVTQTLPVQDKHESLRVMRIPLLAVLILAACTTASGQERVDLSTANGMRFSAQWTDAGKNAPVALFFPMCWATPPETWAPVPAALKARGVSALVTTYPGSLGNSPWPGPQPPPEPQDVYWAEQFRQVREAALRFINGRTERPIVVGGSSCGVERALDLAADHPDRVVAVIAFAGAHRPRHTAYVRSRRVPVLGLSSRTEGEWVIQHDLLVKASGHPASRLIVREEAGHGTVLLKDQAFAVEIADWVADRLLGR